MPDLDGLTARFSRTWDSILQVALSGRKILVVTHIDADGLTSGSIVFAALMRAGANVSIRSLPDLDSKRIEELASLKYDFHIFTDLASTLLSELENAFDGRFLIIDHHQLSKDDEGKPTVINAWYYGYDGGKDACSATMAYYFARAASPSNRDLSPLAVVGAVADRQDVGQDRSLVGLNRLALEEARSSGLITASKDILFTGRETRPIHEAVALTSTPYLPGLSGSKDRVLAILHQTGLRLKDGGAWRTISSLDSEEKGKLIEAIAESLSSTAGASNAVAGLTGEVYTLSYEDGFTPLRDAREFGTLLNACGRMESTGFGVAVCLGDRTVGLNQAMKTLSDYRVEISRALESLYENQSRFQQQGKLVLVRAEGLVSEKLLGPVTSILTSSQAYKNCIVVAFATSRDAELKVSSRVGDSFSGEVNLGLVMREAAETVRGIGGGHTMAAGARIPSDEAEMFTTIVSEKVNA
jgi:single-stranded-DNA-specific exonuclease